MNPKNYGQFEVNSKVDFPRVSCVPFVVLAMLFSLFLLFVFWVAG